MSQQKLLEEFKAALAEDAEGTFAWVTIAFSCLAVELGKRGGFNTDCDILVEGYEGRSITVHASEPKRSAE